MDGDKQQGQPEVEKAYANVFHGIHKRAYLHRLAQHGRVSETEQDTKHLLEIGAKLALASTNPNLQTTAAAESSFAKANAALDEALVEQGIGGNPEKQAEDGVSAEARQAAWDLANDPTLYNSTLTLKKAQQELATAAPDSK